MLAQKQIKQFQKEILDWYKISKRDLPWRRMRDPYKILVSEIMLQQTQVSRVIPKYGAWLKKFPILQSLAKAKTADVLRLWSGLGYNRRALYLKRIAEVIVKEYKNNIPTDIDVLRKLPGIGDYTARAIACFAFDTQMAVVDTNIRKIISLKFFYGKPSKPSELQEIANQLLPVGNAYNWNHALMDYSQAMLSKMRIPIPKQSKFLGSNRYYRGQIVKLLLARKKIELGELKDLLKKDRGLDSIIDGLARDGLIKRSQKIISLVS